MSKVSELSMLALELKKCAEALIGISEGLADMFSGSEEEKAPAKKVAAKKAARPFSGDIEPAKPLLTPAKVEPGKKRVVKKPSRDEAPF